MSRSRVLVKSPEASRGFLFLAMMLGYWRRVRACLIPAADSSLALGALSMYQPGLEAPLFQPAHDLVLGEAENPGETRMDWIFPRAMANKLPLISPGIRAKLETARVARLATLDAERRPHAVPICFVFDGSVFYSAIDRKPKRVAPSRLARLKNIKETPQVALLVDQYDEDWTRLWYVLVRGEAELVSASAEHKRAIQRLRAKYPQYDADMLADDAPVLRITPVRITAWGKI